MQEVFQKLVEDKILNPQSVEHLERHIKENPNFTLQSVLKNLGLSSERIHYYLSFQKTQSEHLSQTPSSQKNFSGYEIIGEIARGGMGVVYKAKEPNGRIVALKVLLADMLSNSTQKKRFYREAETTASLNHPNIVPVYTMKEEGRSPYLTMKYIEGMSFQQYIDSEDFSLPKGLEILRKVAEALDYAHRKKVIHRDIKPCNILIDQSGEPYLTDFGLARFTDRQSDLTQTEAKLGTPHYMAPEQIQKSVRHVTNRSDIYSLGIILYQMLTSKLPFEGSTLHELYYNISRGYPKLPDRKKYGALVDICYKGIDLNPEKRYQTASQMAEDIKLYQQGKQRKIRKLSLFTYLKIYRKLSYSLAAFCFLIFLFLLYFLWPKPEVKAKKRPISEHWKLAQKHFSTKDYDQSLKHVLEIISRKPKNTKAIRLQIEIALKQKKYEDMRIACMQLFQSTNKTKDLDFIAQKTYEHGYYRQSYQYWHKAFSLSHNRKFQSALANSLFLAGDYEKSLKIYQKISHKSPLDHHNLAHIYFYLEDDAKIRRNVLSAQKAKDVYILEELHILQALMDWMKIKQLLGHKWLCEEKQKNSKVDQKLVEIQKCFQKSSLAIKSYQHHREKLLKEKITFFLKTISIERGTQELHRESFEKELAKFQFPIRLYVFFRQIMIRHWIRNKKWEKALSFSHTSIYEFPWVSSFYQLRAFVFSHKRQWKKALADTFSSTTLEPFNFIALSNISEALLQRLSHFEMILPRPPFFEI